MSTPLAAVEAMTPAEFRRLRESLGLSQEGLARRLDVSQRTIFNIEAAERPVDTRSALAIRKLVDDANAAGIMREPPRKARRRL